MKQLFLSIVAVLLLVQGQAQSLRASTLATSFSASQAPSWNHSARFKKRLVTGLIVDGAICCAGGLFLIANANGGQLASGRAFNSFGTALEWYAGATFVAGGAICMVGGIAAAIALKHSHGRFSVVGNGNSMGLAYSF